MKSHDELVEENSGWCLAKPGDVYCVYLFGDQQTTLDLPAGTHSVSWFNPWTGGELIRGTTLTGPGKQPIGRPPSEAGKDWVAVIRMNGSPDASKP